VQILAALDIGLLYFLPSAVFIACYWRILVVVRQRQIKVSPGTTTKSFTASRPTNVDASSVQERHVNLMDTSTSTVNSLNNSTHLISRKQMNVLHTMILITASFIILWMPAALTILFVYFQVCLFLFLARKASAI
jgi:membrane protein insertase Oxa1/YidC/SpoIIIJ